MQPTVDTEQRKIWGLHPNIFFLGAVSFLTDVSSEMIFTLIPLFLSNILGAGGAIVGLVGGLSEATDAVFRIFSGWFSDRIRRHKVLAVTGYSLSTIVKPFMYLASSWGIVLGVRFGDRIGKGIRSSPRDALVAESVSLRERGKGFGLHRAMDTSGAVLGLVAAAIIIYAVQGGGIELGLRSYQWLVLIGVIPAALALLVLLSFVREKRHEPLIKDRPAVTTPVIPAKLGTRFKIFLAIIVIFTLGNSSDFFIILRAQNLEVPLIQVVLMLVLHNVVYAAASLPMGMLSDRIGRKRVISMGWAVYALVYLGFALASSLWQMWLLFAAYGAYYGIAEGVSKAFIADMIPSGKRGTAYGIFQGAVGLSLLPASLIAGWLWDAVSPAAPFYLGAGLAVLAMLGLLTLVRE